MSDPTAPAQPEVVRTVRDGVVWITLNRPEAGNAITTAMREQIIAWLEEASADLGVRVVVLTGSGEKGFCTGADLRAAVPELPRPEGAPARAVGEAARLIRTGWQRLISAVLDCEKPVIAAVNATAGRGWDASGPGLRPGAGGRGGQVHRGLRPTGIAPDAGGAYLLPRLIGPQRAKELFFFGDDLPAGEAERLGLVNRVVPRDQLAEVAGQWASRLATGPTRAIGMAKYLTNQSLESDRATALWDEAVAQELVTGTEDCREGLAAFAERRTPVFRGW